MQPPGGNGQQPVPFGGHQQHVTSQHIMPVGSQHGPHAKSVDQRHSCSSAFTAPPTGQYTSPGHPSQLPLDQAYIHGKFCCFYKISSIIWRCFFEISHIPT